MYLSHGCELFTQNYDLLIVVPFLIYQAKNSGSYWQPCCEANIVNEGVDVRNAKIEHRELKIEGLVFFSTFFWRFAYEGDSQDSWSWSKTLNLNHCEYFRHLTFTGSSIEPWKYKFKVLILAKVSCCLFTHSLELVNKIPFTAPNVESATKIGITKAKLPKVLFAKVTATASDPRWMNRK